jgi:hypothetical protein
VLKFPIQQDDKVDEPKDDEDDGPKGTPILDQRPNKSKPSPKPNATTPKPHPVKPEPGSGEESSGAALPDEQQHLISKLPMPLLVLPSSCSKVTRGAPVNSMLCATPRVQRHCSSECKSASSPKDKGSRMRTEPASNILMPS